MTELNSCSINNNLNTAQKRAEISSTANNTVECSDRLPGIVHYQRLDSKTILQNMEEVLDSVKKQHKEKHRRKKELKKLARVEATHDSEFDKTTDKVLKDKEKEHSGKKHKNREKEKRRSKNELLQEKVAAENGKVLQESPSKSGTILQHFARTPKKEENANTQGDEVQIINDDKSENIVKVLSPPNISKITNAFEVMMNARNKCIGSNTPGKDSPSPVADKELAIANAKRKLKMQEWAEQKGATKRKLEEEARAAYVEEKLDERAKRFKQMLVSGAASPKKVNPTTAKTERKAKTDRKKLKKRKGTRVRRLTSVDSVDSLEALTPTENDVETSEFLSKLNSPTKKRDSLLGYFHKKESRNELAVKKISKEVKKPKKGSKKYTSKRSHKKSSSREEYTESESNQDKEGDSNQNEEEASNHGKERENSHDKQVQISIPSGRPRRSCAGKARYDYDLEESVSKSLKKEKSAAVRKIVTCKTNTPTLVVQQELECVDTIIIDDSTNMSSCATTTPNGTPKKLAPLFVRSLPKPSPDPEIIKARKAFLQSGVPEKLRLEQERQKQYEHNFEETTEMFPKVSHVKQLVEHELEFDTEILKISLKLKSEESMLLPSSPTRKSKGRSNKQTITGLLEDCNIYDAQLQRSSSQDFFLDQIMLHSIENKRDVIKKWKAEFERFPTFKCYNQMREKYRYFSAIDSAQDTEQVSESFVVTRQTRRSLEAQKKNESDNLDEEYKPPATAPNGELLFSEKYKPLLFEQVLVNLSPVTQLKEFLSNWSNSGSTSARNSQNFDDSVDANDSNCSNQGPSANTVVLLGPVSSGKTNAVFALANEMNFNVLEINAGMRRTGKRMIQELQEATQSHQIRKDAAGSVSSQKSLLKMSLNGLKPNVRRRNSISNQLEPPNVDSNSDLQHSARKCLILIEDADIVFDQTDAGFTDAIYSLAASSKRPVIIVATNPNCAHLQRLILQNTIHFSSPNVLNISKFLAVLSLMENCPVQLDDLISLYLYNRRDLRKTLLELQFFIQSGGDRRRQFQKEMVSKAAEKENLNYFASPRKRQFSVEQESEASDSTIPTDKNNACKKGSDQLYTHRSLFEYYTVGQNTKLRIPFPVDFHLLNANLNEIFKVSRKLMDNICPKTCEKTTKFTTAKRKTKSPKKQWLTTARVDLKTPLDNMCSFYENLSIAALMDEQFNAFHFQNKPNPSIIDRLKPKISETISHCLLEKSIEINLESQFCPYNLFDTPKNRVSLCEELSSMQLRSYRARYLDYEPSLRSICRSEKIRSTIERRSTRFYHYLRNYSTNVCNFSTLNFDQACEVFEISDVEENPPTSSQ